MLNMMCSLGCGLIATVWKLQNERMTCSACLVGFHLVTSAWVPTAPDPERAVMSRNRRPMVRDASQLPVDSAGCLAR